MAQHLVLCAVLCSTLFAFCVPTLAQQSTRIPKIGFLGVRPDDSKGTFQLLKRELRTLGYIDGKISPCCIEMPKTNSNDFRPWPMSWFVQKSMSWWPRQPMKPEPLRMPQRLYRSLG
jgi:hypothetical protein